MQQGEAERSALFELVATAEGRGWLEGASQMATKRTP
jgi:hypothetical protein